MQLTVDCSFLGMFELHTLIVPFFITELKTLFEGDSRIFFSYFSNNYCNY